MSVRVLMCEFENLYMCVRGYVCVYCAFVRVPMHVCLCVCVLHVCMRMCVSMCGM